MHADRAEPINLVLPSSRRQRGGFGAQGADRPAVPGDAVFWLAQDDGDAAPARPSDQPQTGSAVDARDGAGGDLAQAEHQQAASRESHLSLSAAQAGDR